MDLKALSYFVATYEEGSVTAAAKRCHISQPSISGAIANLESQLDVQVFQRHKKGVTPTQSGTQLYNAARKLLNDAEAIKGLFVPRQQRISLCLGLMEALDARRISKLLAQLTRDEKHLDLKLCRAQETCDARIICEAAKAPHEAFKLLWREPFVLALPEGHPLTLKEEILVPDLDGVPLIAREYCGNDLIEACRNFGIELNIVATAYAEEWAVALVEAGVGISIIPKGYLSSNHRLVIRRFSNLEIFRQVGIAYDPKTLEKQQGEGLKRLLKSM